MPENPIHAPYGDIFFADFSHTDRAVDRLYNEQQQRQAYQQREALALDDMLSKEFGKIRSVDTPEVIDGYQRYKQLKKQLLFDKKAQRDPQLYNTLQREAGLALQDVYKRINRSQELLEGAKMEDQSRVKNPNLYDDNYGDMRATFWNTPMSKLAETEHGDLSNPDTYRYKGSNTDFQKLLTAAMGQPKQVFSSEELVDKKGLQSKVTPYTFGNSPAQVKESLLGAFAMHGAGRDAELLWDQLPQQEVETTIAQYKNIPQSKLERMGLSGLQDLTPKNAQSKAENYASYLAMKYAINNEPKQGTPQYRNNKEAQMSQSLQDWMTKEGIRQRNRNQLADLRFQYRQQGKKMDAAQEGLWLESYMGTLVDDANAVPKLRVKNADGTEREEHQIPVDRVSAQAFTKQIGSQKVEPDRIAITSDGKIRPIFYKYKDGKPERSKEGWYLEDNLLSQPISMQQFKLNLSKLTQTAKQRAGEMSAETGGQAPANTTAEDVKKKYNISYD